MTKRPLPPSSRLWLLDEIKLWRSDGLLTEDQADAILDLYETPRQSSERQQSVAIYGLVAIAALFIGLAVLLLVGYNWSALPQIVKLFFVLSTLLGTYAGAFHLRYTFRAKSFSEIAFFLGSLFYGAAIWLVADIFELHGHYPDGVWWWALGVMPLALCLDTLLLHALVVALLATWIGMEILGFGHLGFWLFGRFPGLPNGCWSLPIFAGLGLSWAYRAKNYLTVSLYVPLLAWWVLLQPFAWHLHENPIFFIGSVGALLLVLAEVHAEGSRFAIPYRLYGSLLCMGVLATLGFADFQREVIRMGDAGAFFLQSLFITVVSALVFGGAFLLQMRRQDLSYSYLRPLHGFAVRQWLPGAMVLLMFFMSLWHAALGNQIRDRFDWIVVVPTVLANIAMLALSFWLLMIGLREDRGVPFAGGVLYFLLWVVMRYAEFFSDLGLLGASCMFFAAGAALFGFAMFWHRRKKLHERTEA